MKTIPLHSRMYPDLVALVDDGDYELVSQHRWHVSLRHRPGTRDDGPYAQTHIYRADGHRTTIRMHCLILNCAGIDHRNGNGLDNTRGNLRPATTLQNIANQGPRGGSSAYKGVTWKRARRKWQAAIRINGRWRYLGSFTAEADAAYAYDVAALVAWGEFARLNFPREVT